MLTAYALALSAWSAAIASGAGGSALVAALPAVGWLYTLVAFGLWGSGFALAVAAWAGCVGLAVTIRNGS
ncbi:hypothetical protein BH23VER1_BH23VER1_31230 [soil metagenome]